MWLAKSMARCEKKKVGVYIDLDSSWRAGGEQDEVYVYIGHM
jgi:hypothetical protein